MFTVASAFVSLVLACLFLFWLCVLWLRSFGIKWTIFGFGRSRPCPPPSATSPSREELCMFLCLLLGLSFSLLLHARHYFWHWRQSGSRRSKAIRNLSLGNNLLLISSGILRIDLFSILVIFLPGLSSRVWSDAMSWKLCIWFHCGFAQCHSHPQLLFQDLHSWC